MNQCVHVQVCVLLLVTELLLQSTAHGVEADARLATRIVRDRLLDHEPVMLLGPQSRTRSASMAISSSAFHVECWESRPCLFPNLNGSSAEWSFPSMAQLKYLLSHTSGQWLLQELSTAKHEECAKGHNNKVKGCSFTESTERSLPSNYFDGSQGKKSLASIRGSVEVQDDVIVGDTASKVSSEQELVEFIKAHRGGDTPARVKMSQRICGDEWVAYADAVNKTLIVRDADGRSRHIKALADAVRQEIADGSIDVGVSLYYTPHASVVSTIPPHIDVMDVIVVQLEGSKVWTLEAPHPNYFLPSGSVTLPLTKTHFRKFSGSRSSIAQGKHEVPAELRSRILHNTTNRADVVLHAGDWMYIPRGVIHNTTTSADANGSLHISIGIEADPLSTAASFLTRRAVPPPKSAPEKGTLQAFFFGGEFLQGSALISSANYFLGSCIARVMLIGATQHIPELRRSVTYHSPSSQIRDALVKIREMFGGASPASLDDIQSESLSTALRRRWKMLLDKCFTEEFLKRVSDRWWQEPDSFAHVSFEDAIEALAHKFPQAMMVLMDRRSGKGSESIAFWGTLVDILFAEPFFRDLDSTQPVVENCASDPTVEGGCDISPQSHSSAGVGSEQQRFVDGVLQQLHENRLAFADWLWVNEYLWERPPKNDKCAGT